MAHVWTVLSLTHYRAMGTVSPECEALTFLLTTVLEKAQHEYLRSGWFAGTFSCLVTQNNNTAVAGELVKDTTQKVWLNLSGEKISYNPEVFCLSSDPDCFANILRTAFGLHQRQSVKSIFTDAFKPFASSSIHTMNFVLSKHGSRDQMRFHIDGNDPKTQKQYGPVIYVIPPSFTHCPNCTSIVVQLVIDRKRLASLHKNATYRPSYDALLKALNNLDNKIDLQSPNLKDCTVTIRGDVKRTGTILSTFDKGNKFLVKLNDSSEDSPQTIPAHCLDMEEIQECPVPDEIKATCKDFSQLQFALEKNILTAFCLFLSPSRTLTRAALFQGDRIHGVYNVGEGRVTAFGINCSTRLQEEAIREVEKNEKR